MSLTFCGVSGFYRFGRKISVLGVVLSLLICRDLGSTNLLFCLLNPVRLPKHSAGFSLKSQLPPSILCFSFPICTSKWFQQNNTLNVIYSFCSSLLSGIVSHLILVISATPQDLYTDVQILPRCIYSFLVGSLSYFIIVGNLFI